MANYKGNKKKKNIKSKKIPMWAVLLIAAGVLAAGIGIGAALMSGTDGKKSGGSTSASGGAAGEDGKIAEDGVLADCEKEGYITLGNYKGIEVPIEPTENDIYERMGLDAEDVKLPAENTVKMGDYVFIDYTGYTDGKTSDDLQGSNVTLRVGEYNYVKDFENGLIGKKVGKEYSIPVTFPDDYDNGEFAGKTVDFSVTINGKFNDAYAKKASKGKYPTVEEYKKYLQKVLKKENEESVGDTAWDSFMENCEVKKYPKGSVKTATEELHIQYKGFAELQGITYEEQIESLGMTEDDVKEIAKDTVRDRMVAKTIAYREKFTLDDAARKKYLMKFMEYDEKDNMTLKELLSDYAGQYGQHPEDDICVEMAKEYVSGQAIKK